MRATSLNIRAFRYSAELPGFTTPGRGECGENFPAARCQSKRDPSGTTFMSANGIFIGVLSLFSRDPFRDEMDVSSQKDIHRCCLVNLDFFRTGTTILAKAAENIGFAVARKFPCLRRDQHRNFFSSSRGGCSQLLVLPGRIQGGRNKNQD
jgi:hypothetical protein